MPYFTRRLFMAMPPAFAAFPAFAEEVQHLSAEEAYEQAKAGELVLIDIRRPDEWAETGIPAEAIPIDMRVQNLGARIDAALDGNRDRPVALICHTGVRTHYLSTAMAKAGFTAVYNVSEGMAGSDYGPGWLKKGLPVEKPE